jgi:hypothetical protein
MSERELKLVWVNSGATAGHAGKRRRPAAQPREYAQRRKDSGQPGNPGAPLRPTHGQVVACMVVVVSIAIVGLLSGLWAILSYNLESRIMKKVEQSELLVEQVTRRLEESDGLRSAIVDQLRSTNRDRVGKTAAEKSESVE